MGYNRSGNRRTEKQKRAKRDRARAAAKAAASQQPKFEQGAKAPEAPATS